MMRRKLVKQGPSTLTVSLPSDWVKNNKLDQGQEVLVTIERNNVIISTELQEERGSTIAIDVRELSPEIINLLLSSLHKKGYDEIKLHTQRNQLSSIEARVSKGLLGYEIVQQTADSVTIRFITKIDAEELPVLIRRAFLVTIALAEGLAAQADNAKELLVLEETNNRITNYCERILVRNIYHEKDAVFQYVIVWLLEKIADEYREIIKAGSIDKEDSELCLKMLKQFYEIFYKYSLEKHDSFIEQLAKASRHLSEKRSSYITILNTLSEATGSVIAIRVQ